MPASVRLPSMRRARRLALQASLVPTTLSATAISGIASSWQARTYYNAMNVLSAIGTFSKEGGAWLDGLLPVLNANVDAAVKYLSARKGVDFFHPEGTYMLFLNCLDWC